MKGYTVALALVGLLLANTVAAQTTASTTYCAGAEGNSQGCALGCSGTRVNDEVVAGSNQGTFNVGNGNQGDGNDGFNNQGNFNIGSGNVGNCNVNSGGGGGTCDPGNNAGQIVLRFCHVYPSNNRCNPGGYLPEFSSALTAQLPAIVGSCTGVTVPPSSPPPPPGIPTGAPPPGVPSTLPTIPPTVEPVPTTTLPAISDSTADLATLLALLDEHIKQEKILGRKLKL